MDRALVEHFGYELRKASLGIPSFKGPQLIILGHVGQSLPSQKVLVELGCCACFSRPPRQAYLRDALSVALSGGTKLIRTKPDFTLDTGHLIRSAPMNGRYSTGSSHESPVSASSTSKITLEQQTDALNISTSQISTLEITAVRKPRIFVVEDNKVNQMVAQRLLNNLGCQVDVANDGVEAIEILGRTNDYDIIFMDCHMPIMDGFETAKMVRQKGCISRNVPIVALTAATAEGEVEKCITAGMDDYISKPVTRGILHRALDEWVGKNSRWV